MRETSETQSPCSAFIRVFGVERRLVERYEIVSSIWGIEANRGSRSHMTPDSRTLSADANSSEFPAIVTITPERDLERSLVTKLEDLKYEYRPDIRDRATLEANFREKFEALNRVTLTDGEFQRLLDEIVTPDVYEAARLLRNREAFIRDDGTPLNYTLVNIKDWCKNTFEVVNQLRINTDSSHHRYDVMLLINGVPVVQIELKTLGVSPQRAMEQIVNYKNDPGNGYTNTLLCFVQLFVVSNRTDTWYFTNNNARHFAFDANERFLPIYRFAAEDNAKITHLDDFADQFLAKCTLGQMISKYMVLIASEQKLLMMRPYQIYAVKAIVDCIDQNSGNGYIWHTTGSGKTLTSFKASTLLKTNDSIHKCLFVVDRKDLDIQTREEFNRFQENCVEENTNTASLVRRLLSDDYADKVIVTTIQKLGLALDENSKHSKRNHRSGAVNVQAAARAAPRQADGFHLRRMPPLAVRREPQGHQEVLPKRPVLWLHRHPDLQGQCNRQTG